MAERGSTKEQRDRISIYLVLEYNVMRVPNGLLQDGR